MKRLIFSLLVSSVPFFGFSQLEWVYGEPDENCSQMLKTTSGDYALLHGFFTVVDSNGNILFSNYEPPLPVNTYFEGFKIIFERPGNGYGVAADMVGFDPQSGWANGYNDVILYDSFGEFSDYAGAVFIFPDLAVGLSGGDFVLASLNDSYATRVSPNSFPQVWGKHPPGNLRDMALKQVDTLLFLTSQGLIVMDENGSVAGQFPNIKHQRIKVSAENDIACVQGDTVLSYSSNYGLIAQQSFFGDEIKDFDVANGKIAVLTNSDSVHVFDTALQPIGSFQLVEDAAIFNFISAGVQTVTLAGTERYGSEAFNLGTSSTFLKEYGFDGNDFGTSHDIGVVGIEPGPEVEIQQNSSTSYWLILHDVEVTVKNFGDNAVSALSLRAKNNNEASFDSLNLEPGAEQTLIMPQIKLLFGSYPSGQLINFCVWTSHPDFRLDYDASNDSYCTDFLVNDKEAVAQNSIAIYPNPASDVLNFQFLTSRPLANSTLRIVNSEGKVIEEIIIAPSHAPFTIPISDWNTAVYFLQYLEGDTVLHSEKFVKQ